MGRKTKLQLTSYEDLNKMSMEDLADLLKKGIRSSYMKMDALHYRGYEESEYNENFRYMMGETRTKAEQHVNELLKDRDFREIKRLTYYTRRHLNAEDSGVQGVEARERRGLIFLEKMARGMKVTDEYNPRIYRETDPTKGSTVYETEGFRIGKKGIFLTHKELSDIWETIRKVDEMQSLKTLKDSSGDAIAVIYDYIITHPAMTPQDIYEKLKEEKRKDDQKDIDKQREYEERLAKSKGGRQYEDEASREKGKRRWSSKW